MAYIGRDTDKISNVEVLDNITFDGSSSYTLQKGGSNFTPSSANTILLSIDGVVQAGNFTVSGSTIDFGTAVAGTSTCDFILHYGVGLITAPSDGSVTEAKIGTGSVTEAKIGTGAVTSAKLASGAVQNQSAFKNIIINGDMSIAQRGTSATGKTSTGYYTADRFEMLISSAGTWTQTQDTTVPSGQGFAKSLKMDCTTADASLGAGDYLILRQKFEGQNLQYLKKGTSSAESLTASFWVRSNKTGTYIVELFDDDNSRMIQQSYTISSADTWEKKTLTFAGDTTGAFDNDNAGSLSVNFFLGAGTDYTSGTLNTSWNSATAANRAVGQVNLADSTSNEWYITGIQLEAGTSASDFEFLPHDVNFQRCLRYFGKIFSNVLNAQGVVTSFFTSSRAFFRLPHVVTMRTSPTVGTSGVTVLVAQDGGTATTTTFANTFPDETSSSVEITGTFQTTRSGHVDHSAGTMTVSAEL